MFVDRRGVESKIFIDSGKIGEFMKRMHMTSRLLILVLLIVGCGSDKPLVGPPIFKTPTINGTPEQAIESFIFYYEKKDVVTYANLFTGDFLFEFSNSADPDLANEYSAGWFREDEVIATGRLFAGGVNNDGNFLSYAQAIELDLADQVPQPDGSGGRDSASHAVLFTTLSLTIRLFSAADAPPDGGPIIEIGVAEPAVHRFFLVRGDWANGLDENQPADDKHWYIWLWRDESTASRTPTGVDGAEAGSPPAYEARTWGALKGLYR
jgi:hypothetical protein